MAPSEYLERIYAATDAERRLRLPEQAYWDIFPFDPDHLVVKPLRDAEFPEPPRAGEGGTSCGRCDDPTRGVVWSNDRWVLTGFEETGLPFAAMLMPKAHLDLDDLTEDMSAELGVLTVRVSRAAGALPDVGRVHINKWGDGGAHLHIFFLGRPAGLQQLRGSNLALWDEMLPPVPADEMNQALNRVAAALG